MWQLAAESPSSLIGVFAYTVQCTGTVTSVRARGFCPSSTDGSGVIMQIINSTLQDGIVLIHNTNVTAECNTSAPVGSDYYEGYVNASNLSINVVSGGFLGVRFSQICTNESCFFQTATIDQTSSHNVFFVNVDLMQTDPEVSLFFSATISFITG